MANVTFIGACGTVTGSRTLLEWGETRVLVDCGMYQGDDEVEQRNWDDFELEPHALQAIVVTHAHLDHTGLLPRLVARGFDGPIYCTRASRGLVSLILEDSGGLQEEQAAYARRKGYSRHPDPQPLYDSRDARRTMKLLEPRPFDEPLELAPGITARFLRAGHLLGAASVEIGGKGADGERRRWLFSGDVGRYEVPVLKNPESPEETPDALLLESTYGDRRHQAGDAQVALGEVIERTFARGGSVIIPAFALGRTQEVLYHLAKLVEEERLDPGAVFLDSPMAIRATELYERFHGEHDRELEALQDSGLDPLGDEFQRCRSSDESKALNDRREPAVIVAASGMATGGRVVHHLKQKLPDERAAVVFVGFQAAGTRGRALVEGVDRVAIHGSDIPVRAEIHSLRHLSAHADSEELLRWCEALPGAPQRVFLNHGEDPARKALAAALRERLGWPDVTLPTPRTRVPW